MVIFSFMLMTDPIYKVSLEGMAPISSSVFYLIDVIFRLNVGVYFLSFDRSSTVHPEKCLSCATLPFSPRLSVNNERQPTGERKDVCEREGKAKKRDRERVGVSEQTRKRRKERQTFTINEAITQTHRQ